jgi:phosphopantetheinyl transferase (holo-ACP synthase)
VIGNDVVDLCDPETRPGATHPRFDSRVFARPELALLRRSGAPERLRWILWAAKEAAYKVARKLDPKATFAPARFAVRLDARLRGRVEHAGRRLFVAVRAEPGSLHAIASDAELAPERLLLGQERLAPPAADPGQAVRRLALEELVLRLGAAPSELAIARRGRVPQLLRRGEASGLDLSLSHHGGLVAFACELPLPPGRELPA